MYKETVCIHAEVIFSLFPSKETFLFDFMLEERVERVMLTFH